jgi:hypothetical protein
LISGSFLADVTKLRAVSPRRTGGRLVITVVPTLHSDRMETPKGRTPREHLAVIGFPYVSFPRFMPGPRTPASDETRSEGLQRLVAYFRDQGCPTIIGGALKGSYEGVPVTTDFVVTDIPPITGT